MECDPDRGRWIAEMTTTSWTGGGLVWLTVDGSYVERHFIRSVEAAADGSEDRLTLRLDIVADWRAATAGTSTAFRCVEEVSWRFVVNDLSGDVADCVSAGTDPEHLDQEGVTPCPDT